MNFRNSTGSASHVNVVLYALATLAEIFHYVSKPEHKTNCEKAELEKSDLD